MQHLVFLKLKKDTPRSAEDAIVRQLETLKKIPGVISLGITKQGTDLFEGHKESKSFDLLIYSVFRSAEDLKAYYPHPLHVQYVKKVLEPFRENSVIFDFKLPASHTTPLGSPLDTELPYQHPYPKHLLPPTYQNTGALLPDEKVDKVKLFQPIKIRGLNLKNRIVVSPMCQYSSVDGFPTDYHLRHLTSFAIGGQGLVIFEATGVLPEGRISPLDAGIYYPEHVKAYKRIVDHIHDWGGAAGIQLAHAGRKSSTVPPYASAKRGDRAEADQGGWPDKVVSASALPWGEGWFVPRALTKEGIKEVVDAFVTATKRAEEAGFDLVEIHGAHGYLITQFLSPLSNQRTDEYGGSFENRIRFALEVTRAVRHVWPIHKPLWFRLSCTEWVEGGWDMEDSIKLARILKEEGVDLLDCSSGGNDPRQSVALKKLKNAGTFGYQVPFAERIKKEVPGLFVGAVGALTSPSQVEEILKNNQADVVLLGRQLQREPYFALRAARDLGVNVGWPAPYGWGSKLPLGVDDRTLHAKL